MVSPNHPVQKGMVHSRLAERLFRLVSVFWEAPQLELVLFDSVLEEGIVYFLIFSH